MRGLPLVYSCIGLRGEGRRKGCKRESGEMCVASREEVGKTKGRKGKCWKERLWQYIYEKHRGYMDSGEATLHSIVLETNESSMLRGGGEAILEEVVRKMAKWGEAEIVVIVPSAFQLPF